MIIKTAFGSEFSVRVIKKGERHGLNNCLTRRKDDPLVEFYDRTRSQVNGLGQFVASYSASTLLKHEVGVGLNLEIGIPLWYVDWNALSPVIESLRTGK